MRLGPAIVALVIFAILLGVLTMWMLKPKRGKNLSKGKDNTRADEI